MDTLPKVQLIVALQVYNTLSDFQRHYHKFSSSRTLIERVVVDTRVDERSEIHRVGSSGLTHLDHGFRPRPPHRLARLQPGLHGIFHFP